MNKKRLMNLSKWQESEHSFLKMFCTFEQHPWGVKYFWDEGKQWPKFNFCRLFTNEITEGELVKLHQDLQSLGGVLNLKVDISKSLPIHLAGKLKYGGIPIAYSITDSRELLFAKGVEMELVKVKDMSNLKEWWLINSESRDRDKPLENPLFKKLVLGFNDNDFYIAKVHGEEVGSVAVTKFPDGINVWGLAVMKKYRGRGYMKSIFSKLSEKLEERRFYCQTNLNSETFNFLLKKSSTEILSIEKKYEYVGLVTKSVYK